MGHKVSPRSVLAMQRGVYGPVPSGRDCVLQRAESAVPVVQAAQVDLPATAELWAQQEGMGMNAKKFCSSGGVGRAIEATLDPCLNKYIWMSNSTAELISIYAVVLQYTANPAVHCRL